MLQICLHFYIVLMQFDEDSLSGPNTLQGSQLDNCRKLLSLRVRKPYGFLRLWDLPTEQWSKSTIKIFWKMGHWAQNEGSAMATPVENWRGTSINKELWIWRVWRDPVWRNGLWSLVRRSPNSGIGVEAVKLAKGGCKTYWIKGCH